MTSMEAYLVEADQALDTGRALPIVDGIPVLPGWDVLDGLPYRLPVVAGRYRAYSWMVEYCRYDQPPRGVDPAAWRRELRLWACDCAERTLASLDPPCIPAAIAVARRYAIGEAGRAELTEAARLASIRAADEVVVDGGDEVWSSAWTDAAMAAVWAADTDDEAAGRAADTAAWAAAVWSDVEYPRVDPDARAAEKVDQEIMLAKRLQGLL